MRNRSRRSRGSDEINLTPLLDVLFTILFIVMLTGMQNERSMEESAQESEAQITGLESRVDALEEENDILKSEVSRRDKIQDSNKRYESNAVIVTLINETEDGEHVLKVYKGQEEPMETFRLGTDRTEYTRKHLTQIINEIVDEAGGYPVFIVFHCDAKQIYRKEEFNPIRDALETQKKLRKEVFIRSWRSDVMANDRNNNERGGGRSAIGILALLLLLGGGGYFGLGPGKGLLPGNGNSTETAQEESASETQEAADPEKDKEKAEDPRNEEIPDVIVVRIKEDKVTINGHEVANQEELRKYVEEYNSDTRTFVLEEEQSILETYNWVKAVFDELDIQLKNSK